MSNDFTPVIGVIEDKNGKKIWKIENFSIIEKDFATEQSHFYSPVFTTSTPIPNSPLLRWQFKLYPNFIKEDKKYISVYVIYLSNFEVTAFISISLLSDKHERLFKRRFEGALTFNSESTNWGFPQFTNKNDLTGHQTAGEPLLKRTRYCYLGYREYKQPFLMKDTLRMSCSFTFVNSTLTEEGLRQMDHYKNLFDSGSYSDVTFVIGKHKLQLHKAILTGFSPVFQAMFEHDMKKKKQTIITIKDIKLDTMKEMFRYIYQRQVQHVKKNAVDLLVAAEKYSVLGLKTLCEQTLSASLNLDNAIDHLRLAILHNALHLKSKVIDFILNQLKDFIEREDFKKMDSRCSYEVFKAITQKEANK